MLGDAEIRVSSVAYFGFDPERLCLRMDRTLVMGFSKAPLIFYYK